MIVRSVTSPFPSCATTCWHRASRSTALFVPHVYEGADSGGTWYVLSMSFVVNRSSAALRLFIKGQDPYSAPATYLPLKTVPGRGLLRRHNVSTSGERGVPMVSRNSQSYVYVNSVHVGFRASTVLLCIDYQRLLGVIQEELLKMKPSVCIVTPFVCVVMC